MFLCKTRGQRVESAAKPRAVICQSVLKRSERSLHWLRTNRDWAWRGYQQGGRRRRRQEDRSLCRGGRRTSEHMVSHHMTGGESRAAALCLTCNNAQSWSCSWIHSFEYKSVYTAADAGESSLVASTHTHTHTHTHTLNTEHYMRFWIPAWATLSAAKECWKTLTRNLKLYITIFKAAGKRQILNRKYCFSHG